MLTITAAFGTRLAIQRIGAVIETEWAQLDDFVLDTTSLDWADQTTSSNSARFYRVKLLP